MSSFRSQPGQPKGKLLSIERVVALLTPFFAAGAGWVTSLIAKAIPGVDLNPAEITALFGTGTAAALAAAIKWLHGRAHYTELLTELSVGGHRVENSLSPLLSSAPVKDIEQILEAHRQQIIQDIGNKLPIPPSAQDVAREIIGQLWPKAQPPAQPAAAAQGQPSAQPSQAS